MDKNLNNWLDKVEGKPENTTNRAIEKEIARQHDGIERDCMNCEKTFLTTNKDNQDYCQDCR